MIDSQLCGRRRASRFAVVLARSSHVLLSRAPLARFLAQIKSMALGTPINGRILRMTCPEHEGQVLKLFVLILSKVTSCLTVYFSFFFFFFFRSGEEGEDALRQSAMSSSEIAGLIF